MQREPKPNLRPGTDVEGMAVVELLGVGGYGAVYRAQLPSGRECALKFIPYSTSLERALREFFILLQLRHRNVVRVSALGVWPEDKPEFLWLKMEFIEGERLDTWARARALTARTAARLTLEVCRGLAFAHGLKVVHRDVKEANILVRESDGEAVLIDFGLGTYEDALTLTSGPVPAGTSGYQAPELLRHAHAFDNQEVTDKYTSGPGDDLYALGVVLYRLLTGKAPVDGEDELAVINDEPLPVLVVNPVIPPELAGVCMRLLQKSPGGRYESAAALCAVLEDLLLRAGAAWDLPLLGSAPASQAPASRSSARRRTQLRRRRQLGALAASVVAVLAAGTWVSVAGLPGRNVPVAPPEKAAKPEEPMTSLASGTTQTGGKFASLNDSPDAGGAAVPPLVPETPPAAVASAATLRTKDNGMSKAPSSRGSTSARSLLLGCSVMAISTGAPGCAGNTRLTRPPEPEACPRSALDAMKRHKIPFSPRGDDPNAPSVLWGMDRIGTITVIGEGETTFKLLDPIGDLPRGTQLDGVVIYGTGANAWGGKGPRAFVRITAATPPGGDTFKICGSVFKQGDGIPFEEGATFERPLMSNVATMRIVSRFEEE